MNFLTIVIIVILAFVVLALKYRWIWRQQKKKYAKIQSGRTSLSDETFCTKLQLDASTIRIVSIVRSKLAEQGHYDPLRIYTDDKFYPHFGLTYDDEVGSFVYNMKIIEGYEVDYFPLGEVETVGDFVKTLLRLKKEFEETKTSLNISAPI